MSKSAMTSVRACPICRGLHCGILSSQRFVVPAGHPLAQGYDVVVCARCGFVYADSAATQDDYDRFYAEESKYEVGPAATGGGETPWDLRRLQETARCLTDFLAAPGARVLDVGCGNGGLLRCLKELGQTDLVGLDPSPICAATTRAAGTMAHVGGLSAPPAELGRFDLVILSHVLEHVLDLRGAVARIAALTAPGGHVYVEVPDPLRYADFLYAPFQEFNTEHINHFSHVAMANLLAPAGLEPVRESVKVFESPARIEYPALYGFYRKGAVQAREPARDTLLEERLTVYVRKSLALMTAIDARIQAVLRASPTVVVWGTGQLVMKLLAETSLGTATIAAFVDGSPKQQGRLLHGVRILAPPQARDLPFPIIIGSTLHQEEIAEAIRTRWQLTNPVVKLRDPAIVCQE